MKTIFDFEPTGQELDALGFYSFLTSAALRHVGDMTKAVYLEKVDSETATFDVARLLELRGLDASEYWDKIPKRRDEYRRGFDYMTIPE